MRSNAFNPPSGKDMQSSKGWISYQALDTIGKTNPKQLKSKYVNYIYQIYTV